MVSGCCLWKEVEQSKPARSKLESLFPERLFRREKKHCPNHSRKNLQLPEKRESVAKKDCKTPALGKGLLVPKPCRARLWHLPGCRPLSPDRSPWPPQLRAWDTKRHNQVAKGLPGLQTHTAPRRTEGPWEPLGGRS